MEGASEAQWYEEQIRRGNLQAPTPAPSSVTSVDQPAGSLRQIIGVEKDAASPMGRMLAAKTAVSVLHAPAPPHAHVPYSRLNCAPSGMACGGARPQAAGVGMAFAVSCLY